MEQNKEVAKKTNRTRVSYKVKQEELLCAPNPFQHTSEYEQRVHIEEEVAESAMHEHIGKRLPDAEKW